MIRQKDADRVMLSDFTVDGDIETQLYYTPDAVYGRYGLFERSAPRAGVCVPDAVKRTILNRMR